MTPQATTQSAHDPKARSVAKAVYDALNPCVVILFGSRARGDFRRDSDVDLLVITDGDCAPLSESGFSRLKDFQDSTGERVCYRRALVGNRIGGIFQLWRKAQDRRNGILKIP